jgi:hypothetical protein
MRASTEQRLRLLKRDCQQERALEPTRVRADGNDRRALSCPDWRQGLAIIGKLLGHAQSATTQRYAHLDADPRRRAANAIGATIVSASDGNLLKKDFGPRSRNG